jgi:UDP-glucose 4-epimerase
LNDFDEMWWKVFVFLECLKRVEQIVGRKITNYVVDCLDLGSLRDIFKKHSIYAIINFAALKSVGESVQKPVLYYKNNVGCLLNLLTVRFILIVNFFLHWNLSSVWKNLM